MLATAFFSSVCVGDWLRTRRRTTECPNAVWDRLPSYLESVNQLSGYIYEDK